MVIHSAKSFLAGLDILRIAAAAVKLAVRGHKITILLDKMTTFFDKIAYNIV